MRAQFRPCIDLHAGKVKQIVGGSWRAGEAVTNFSTDADPADFARLYRDSGLTGGHVIMLGPGNEAAAKRALGAAPGTLQIGGGITPENAAEFLDAGAAAVIVTSFVFHDGELDFGRLSQMVAAVGKERLVLDLSCRRRDGKYYVVTDLWQKYTRESVGGELLVKLSSSAREFLIHAVDVEGKCAGIDAELIRILAAESPVDCVYAGGVRSLSDIEEIERLGQGKIHYTIGSALDIFGGRLAFAAVVAHALGNNNQSTRGGENE